MKTNNRKNNACVLKLATFAFLFSFIVSCSETSITNSEIKTVQYQMADDYVVTVSLDPYFQHSHHTFSSLEEHDTYLETLEDNGGPLVVNKQMYEELSHYYDPFIISALDMNRTVTVGNSQYRATKEAAYTRELDTDEWKLHVYYGLSGKVDLMETTLVHENILDLDALKDYKFKSPESENVYKNQIIKRDLAASAKTQGKDEDHYYLKDTYNNWIYVHYRDLPSGTSGEPFRARIRWYCWNESYKSWGRKGKGGTVTQKYVLYGRHGEVRNKWTSVVGTAPLGSYHKSGARDYSKPYVYVKVETSKGSKSRTRNEWSTSIDGQSRKANKGTWSYHTAGIRPDNNNNYSIRMHSHKVD